MRAAFTPVECEIRAGTRLPVLRKDFVVDELQIWQARAAGADAVLLIVRVLDDAQLGALVRVTRDVGMDALVEVHDEVELERALTAGAELVGVNNRDLTVFRTDLATSERLAPRVPSAVVLVAESGIGGGEDVARLGAAGVDAVLVGETLMRAPDPAAVLRDLTATRRTGRAG